MASAIDIDQALEAFLHDRSVTRPSALLTWTALWNAYQVWCIEKRLLPLPLAEALQKAMSKRYEAHPITDRQMAWAGIALTQEEWMGDEES